MLTLPSCSRRAAASSSLLAHPAAASFSKTRLVFFSLRRIQSPLNIDRYSFYFFIITTININIFLFWGNQNRFISFTWKYCSILIFHVLLFFVFCEGSWNKNSQYIYFNFFFQMNKTKKTITILVGLLINNLIGSFLHPFQVLWYINILHYN